MMNRQAQITAIDRLLDQERTALLSGDLGSLARMADEKERLANALQDAPHGPLIQLWQKAQRNQDLLEHTLKGIRAVGDRLEALDVMRHSIETYDRQGNRHQIKGLSKPGVEKRA